MPPWVLCSVTCIIVQFLTELHLLLWDFKVPSHRGFEISAPRTCHSRSAASNCPADFPAIRIRAIKQVFCLHACNAPMVSTPCLLSGLQLLSGSPQHLVVCEAQSASLWHSVAFGALFGSLTHLLELVLSLGLCCSLLSLKLCLGPH